MNEAVSTRILCVAVRTTGSNSAVHSIVDVGAVWVSGGEPACQGFSSSCSAFEGAEFQERTSELTGISQSMATDPYLSSEGELIRKFVHWAGANREPVILAGLRPSMVRSFLLAAFRRSDHWPNTAQRPNFHPRILDVHSLFLAQRLTQLLPVPSRGFHRSEIFEALGVLPVSYARPAIDCAKAERELILKLL